jgi:hypothetical protein
MRFVCLTWVTIALAVIVTVGIYASDEFFYGGYQDFQGLPPQINQQDEFTFVRLIYNGRIRGYYKNWYTDYPKGEAQLIPILKRMTNVDVAPEGRSLPIHHPDLFNYPMIYSVEGGQMVLDDSDAKVLREYVDRGGFWMIDDFWGTFEWSNFQAHIKKVFPDRDIVDLPAEHPILHSFFDVDEILQVPNSGYAHCHECPTWEQDGFKPFIKGISDADGRLLVLINFNTDLMDASEWSDDPLYPSRFSAYSYKIFTNTLVYALSH